MIFVLHGFKGSGKDEFFKVLEKNDSRYKKLAFADPIKEKVKKIYNLISDEEYDIFKRSEYCLLRNVDGRQMVREIGMLMRSYDDGKQFIDYVDRNLSEYTCVTDLRFQTELEFFKNLKSTRDVKLIKIIRYSSDDEHITEQEIHDSEFEYIIENTGTLEDFHTNINEFINRL